MLGWADAERRVRTLARRECTCSQQMITRYQKRISGPMLDRIDIHAEVPRDCVQVDRRIGRAADRRIDGDGVLERLARHDVARF